jgi:RNA polymerase sigma-70 factor, ECF subfamily
MTQTDFELSVHHHQSMVYSVCWNFFRNEALAEEVAQDVFLKLYENRNAVETGSHCIAWLRRTAIHRCIDARRKSSFLHEVQLEQLPEISVDPSQSDPLLWSRLGRLIASLPEKPRAVMVLRYGEDMDADEIATMLNMPVRTVWSHLQRSLALLREKAASQEERTIERIRTKSS